MSRILITGANGYLGARLSRLFSQKGYEVTGICFPSVPDNPSWQSLFKDLLCLDMRDKTSVEKITNENFDAAIHLVSLDHHQSDGDPDYVTSVNVTPTLALLKKFSEKKTLKKFIYFSTVHVYGRLGPMSIDERNNTHPMNVYALTHLLSENICNFYNNNSEINCYSVRLSNSYGSPVFYDNNCWWLVVNDLCRMAFRESKIILKSDGTPQRDFIHWSDIFRAVECLILNKIKDNTNNTFNLSSGETKTILELAFIIKSVYSDMFNKKLEIFTPGKVLSNITVTNDNTKKYLIDNSKIRSLGFKSSTDLVSGISELFKYFKDNAV